MVWVDVLGLTPHKAELTTPDPAAENPNLPSVAREAVNNQLAVINQKIIDIIKKLKDIYAKYKPSISHPGGGRGAIGIDDPKVRGYIDGLCDQLDYFKLQRDILNSLETKGPLNALRDITPFKGAGGAARRKEFLDRHRIDTTNHYRCYVSGARITEKEMCPDHIVPVVEIFKMKGFLNLSYDHQREILDLPDNLLPLEATLNSSKGSMSFSDWLKKGQVRARISSLNGGRPFSGEEEEKLRNIYNSAYGKLSEEISNRLNAQAQDETT